MKRRSLRNWREEIGQRKRDCLDAAALIGQETNPTGPGHRFGADDSVLSARIPQFDRYRLCHASRTPTLIPSQEYLLEISNSCCIYTERETANLYLVSYTAFLKVHGIDKRGREKGRGQQLG